MTQLSAWQAAIVAEVESWADPATPYHHMAAIKGVGVDCAMLPLRVFQALGVIPPDVDPRPYPHDWMLHRDDSRYRDWAEKFADKVDDPQPGDLALFRVGRCLAHGGIVVGPDLMIHACLHAGRVERSEIRRYADTLGGYWRFRE